MSHLIVEVINLLPVEEKSILVIPENWIVDESVFYPDDSYSQAYKDQLLEGGHSPDTKKWESFEIYKILGTYGKFVIKLFSPLCLLNIAFDSTYIQNHYKKLGIHFQFGQRNLLRITMILKSFQGEKTDSANQPK